MLPYPCKGAGGRHELMSTSTKFLFGDIFMASTTILQATNKVYGTCSRKKTNKVRNRYSCIQIYIYKVELR